MPCKKHKLFSDRPWGYSEGKSTETLLLLLTETWKHIIDRGEIVGALFIDFRKAFDVIDHHILLEKLQGFGISGSAYEIIEDYLTDRHQFTEINGSRSQAGSITYGVPQGSLLGPKLFKIFENDLPESVKKGELYMYADDTTAYCVGKCIEEVVDHLNTITKELNEWCVKNKLTVNTEKTQAMIISAKPFIGPLHKLSFGNDTIEFVTETRCLGINIEYRLKWNKQVKNVAKGFSAKVAQLKRLSFLPRKVLEEIYYKSVIACVVYAISVWGTCSKATFNELEKIHERAARLIYNIPAARDPLSSANWKSLSYIYKRRLSLVMHDIYYENAPKELTEMFQKQHTQRGRNQHNLVIQRPRSEHGRNSLIYRGPLTWNLLSPEAKSCHNRGTFSRKLKDCKLDNISYCKEASIGTNKDKDYIYY